MEMIDRFNQLGWKISSPDALDFVKAAYAAFHGISSADVADHLEAPRFCNHPDVMPLSSQVCKWPDGHITWDIVADLPGITKDQVKEGITEALNRWAAVCGITPEYTPGNPRARILVGSRSIDGPLGVLAESELPCGNVLQCHQWYDHENFGFFNGPRTSNKIDFTRIAMHELGHALGMNHIGAGNLLAPVYSDQIWDAQIGDISEMQSRYGRPVVQPSPQPSPQPDKITIEINGTINIPGYRLIKLMGG